MSVKNNPPVQKPAANVFPELFSGCSSLCLGIAFFFLVAFFAVFPAKAQILQYPMGGVIYSITPGPDGAYWGAEYYADNIGRIDTNGIFTIPFQFTSNSGPYSIIVGPDSNIWFTELLVDKIGRISPGTNGSWTNGVLTEFPIHPGVPNANSSPCGITSGPDGNLWFTEYDGDLIGVMNTNGQTLHEYGGFMRATNQLRQIAAGPDGYLWFCEYTYGTIGRMSTSGALTEIPLGLTNILGTNYWYSNSQPLDIVAGPDGAMWFTETSSNRIGRLTVNSNYSDYVLPTISGSSYYNYSQVPYYITVGGDGNLWFTEYISGNVSRITTNGFITEFPTPEGSYLTGIASGRDKNIWFYEYSVSYIAEFLLPTLTSSINSNGQLVLTWPVTATDYVLQGNTNLATTNWTNVTSPPLTVISNQYVYTNTASGIEFFRLFQFAIP
jgi:streptogramin lyase